MKHKSLSFRAGVRVLWTQSRRQIYSQQGDVHQNHPPVPLCFHAFCLQFLNMEFWGHGSCSPLCLTSGVLSGPVTIRTALWYAHECLESGFSKKHAVSKALSEIVCLQSITCWKTFPDGATGKNWNAMIFDPLRNVVVVFVVSAVSLNLV